MASKFAAAEVSAGKAAARIVPVQKRQRTGPDAADVSMQLVIDKYSECGELVFTDYDDSPL